VSGGGDPVLKVWEWRAGRRLYDIAIEETVLPFIAVRRARRKRGYDSDGERKPPTRRWLARERRRQAKVATPSKEEAEATPTSDVEELEEEEEAEFAVESGDEVDDDVVKDATLATPSGEPEPEEPPAPVLVVQKIETLNIGGRLVLAFSAVGYVHSPLPTWTLFQQHLPQRDCAILVCISRRRAGRDAHRTCARLWSPNRHICSHKRE
jgi:tRNA (guanine-N(7)-)-methyltransferase subunit TRM82